PPPSTPSLHDALPISAAAACERHAYGVGGGKGCLLGDLRSSRARPQLRGGRYNLRVVERGPGAEATPLPLPDADYTPTRARICLDRKSTRLNSSHVKI